MIISDKYRFCFVHIPKCAGTSVRRSIEAFDDTKGAFTKRVEEHEILGLLDYVHIPLSVLERYFPLEYRKVRDYTSFAVVRDPFARFPSSLAQRIKMYKGCTLQELSKKEVQKAVDEAISFLDKSRGASLLPPDFIHFQSQNSYIYNGDQRVVDYLYTLDRVSELLARIEEMVDEKFVSRSQPSHQNQTIVYRSALTKNIIILLKPLLSAYMKRFFSERARAAVRSYVYVPGGDKMDKIFRSEYVKSFVAEYYSQDIALFNEVSQTGAL